VEFPYLKPINELVQKVIKFFAAESGVFELVNMLINVVKHIKENKK